MLGLTKYILTTAIRPEGRPAWIMPAIYRLVIGRRRPPNHSLAEAWMSTSEQLLSLESRTAIKWRLVDHLMLERAMSRCITVKIPSLVPLLNRLYLRPQCQWTKSGMTAPQGKLHGSRCVDMRTEVVTSLPGWLSRVQPRNEGQIITVRRECKVILDINMRGLPDPPSQQPVTWRGLVVPSTAGVRTDNYRGEQDVLHLSVRVFGADTRREYNSVCKACNKREGKKKGTPSLVDFHAVSDVIKASEDGLVRVKFQFSCYPKHQNENESAFL